MIFGQLRRVTSCLYRLRSPTGFTTRSLASRTVMSEETSSAAKRPHIMKKIGTHNGCFHCDEVLACFLLQQLPEYQGSQIIRTRDPAVLDTCDIVVDVGGVFDKEKHRYDHHQRSFSETMNSLSPQKKWTTKLSSAGLVYVHFGERIIAQILSVKPNDPFTQLVYDKVYDNFVEEIDAIDNGVNATDEKPRYSVRTNLSSRVGHLYPPWNQPNSPELDMQRFEEAMKLVGAEFLDRVTYYRDAWWPARQIVEEAIEKRFEVDPSGELICFKQGGCPWKDHLFTLEEENIYNPPVKFVLFPDQNAAWRVQAVPKDRGTFENRLSLLQEWCGIRDEELSSLSGIPDCIFVHANGFIGGNKTYNGALQMAKRTLQNKPHP